MIRNNVADFDRTEWFWNGKLIGVAMRLLLVDAITKIVGYVALFVTFLVHPITKYGLVTV